MIAENADARYNEIQKLIHVLIFITIRCMGRGVRPHEVTYTLGELSAEEEKMLLPKWYHLTERNHK